MITRLLCFLFLLTCGVSPASDRNLIYKGTLLQKDIVDRKTSYKYRVYWIFGEETPVNAPSTDRYATIKSALVIVGVKGLPKKRYVKVVPYFQFRTVEVKQLFGSKEKIVEIFHKGDASPTDAGHGFANLAGSVLLGTHPAEGTIASIYDAPLLLRGIGLNFSSGLSPSDEPVFGSAATEKYTLRLVRSLNDPIPGGESLVATVQRVIDYLEGRGYIEIVP